MIDIKLTNGVSMPGMVIGTNWMGKRELKKILHSAFNAGFRAIDTARDYGNEPIVGQALSEVLKETGISREEIFITTKIGNGQQQKGDINGEIEQSLSNLKTDYIDLWLMHWPYPGYFESTWDKMCEIYANTDKTRAIGVANYDIRHFRKLKNNTNGIMPMVNQIECRPLRTISTLREYMKTENITLEAYCPLCRLISPIKESEVLKKLASKYNKSIGQIILRWHLQNNAIPIFKSYNPNRFKENIEIFDFSLSEEETAQISALNQNYKYHLESASCPGY